MDEQNRAECWYHRYLHDSYESSLESLFVTLTVGYCHCWHVAWYDLLSQFVLPTFALCETYWSLLYRCATFCRCRWSCQCRVPEDGWTRWARRLPMDVLDLRPVGSHPGHRVALVAARSPSPAR